MPAYELSEAETNHMIGVERVRNLVRTGMPVKDAIDSAANECGLDIRALLTASQGKRGGLRRAKKRLAKLRG